MVYLIMVVSSIILRLLILELEIKATSHDRIDRVTKNIKKTKEKGTGSKAFARWQWGKHGDVSDGANEINKADDGGEADRALCCG